MNFIPTKIPDVIRIEPDVYHEPRGFFLETYHERKYREGGIRETFVQDNHSCSVKGVLRGLHMQAHHPQGKLVWALEGEVWDVAVDLRRDSETFKQWVSERLSAENHHQLYIPPGFAHGFCALTEQAQFCYKCTDYYNPADELTLLWSDPELGIEWPLDDPLLSAKDQAGLPLEEILKRLP